jgi:mannose-6-phosphate isomerase
MRQYPRELMGRHQGASRFPLLFKFLDAQTRLSMQVHPDNARAALLDPPDLGKTEAWVIVEAAPRSFLYAGLRQGITRETLVHELTRQTCELCVERIEPVSGDCFFLPAGVLHALGPGLLVAEIQQSSDTTYRLYDWNRRGPDGQPRALHVDQALEAINYDCGPVSAQQPQATQRDGVERLVACDQFVLDRWRFAGTMLAGGDDRFHIVAVLSGQVSIAGDPMGPLTAGSVALLPAEAGDVAVTAAGEAVVLDAYLP